MVNSDSSSNGSQRSLRSQGSVPASVLQSASAQPSRALVTAWTEAEESVLITFLVDRRDQASGGQLNFREAVFSAAAEHLNTTFPLNNGPSKKASTVKSKWNSLKRAYFTVRDLKGWAGSASGIHYNDAHGVNLDKSNTMWAEYIKHHKGAKAFSRKGFPHYDALNMALMQDKGKGEYPYRPGQSKAAVLDMSQLSTATLEIQTSSSSAPASMDPSLIPPSIPSSYAAGSDHSSTMMTSISRGKRKLGSVEGSAAPSGTSSGKRSRLSSTAQAQLAQTDMLREMTRTVAQAINNPITIAYAGGAVPPNLTISPDATTANTAAPTADATLAQEPPLAAATRRITFLGDG
ncbi:hypothetical protein BV22DRAFT_1052368 [Leucogyrophana mollusca]|uniref:Uncharacterized protein n=1 Tax=Leucogyrophana mollusca TaxID=85980 RepID=A0ACB8AW98_9AGAM|nr:hypothetical protein BV22DRAFT_1052368 [Leucogyrophana mollusca]